MMILIKQLSTKQSGSRSGRFSHQLIDEKNLDLLLPALQEQMAVFIGLFKNKQLAPYDLVMTYILLFNRLRRPKDFLCGASNKDFNDLQGLESISMKEWLSHVKCEKLTHLARNFMSSSLLHFFCVHGHRSLPLAVNKALAGWAKKDFLLDLWFTIPTPTEVMKMQIHGKRCVSLLLPLIDHPNYNNDRDPLGFLLHDLIHAEKFFSDKSMVRGQTKFLTLLERNLAANELSCFTQDAIFQKELEYLTSDMNSHPAHLLTTYFAILKAAYGRLKISEKEMNQQIFLLFKKWNLPFNVLEKLKIILEFNKNISDTKEDRHLPNHNQHEALEVFTRYMISEEHNPARIFPE